MSNRSLVSLSSPPVAGAALAALVAALAAVASGQSAAHDPRSAPSPEAFRAAAAQALGMAHDDPQLVLDRLEGPLRLADSGLELWVTSALDGRGRKARVALDAAGRSFDLEQARRADAVLGVRRRGKLSRDLAELLERAPQGPVEVAAWLDVPDADLPRVVHSASIAALDEAGLATMPVVEAELEALSRALAQRIDPIGRAFAADLVAQGVEVTHRDPYAPLVFFRADAQRLLAVAADPRVAQLEQAEREYGPRLLGAFNEVRADRLYATYPGADAQSAKVAVVEPERPCEGPFLDVADVRVAGDGGGDSEHTTSVASCIASSSGALPGVARGAQVYGANNATFTEGSTLTVGFQGSVAAISWALSKGCHVLNLSYGAVTPTSTVSGFDKYLDYVARVHSRTLALACGNSGAFAGDPGAGYNCVAVGSFNDGADYDWIGESMSASSSFLNPSTGVETPQIAAPGVALSMLACDPSATNMMSGTSFAAPLVAGTAALLIDRQPTLTGAPEAVRAILMATAWHNIEGATTLSGRDGAGGLDAFAAYRVANRGKGPGYQFGTLFESSFDAKGWFTAQKVYVPAKATVRACLSFDSQVQQNTVWKYTWFDSTLQCDLDFHAFAPNGAEVAVSASSLQPFEVLEFVAPVSGFYTFKIRAESFAGPHEFYGTAVTIDSDMGQ